jgi:hypothetical protein
VQKLPEQMDNSREYSRHNAVFRTSGIGICQLLFKRSHRTVLTNMSQLSNRVELQYFLDCHKRIYPVIRAHHAEAIRRCVFPDYEVPALPSKEPVQEESDLRFAS